MRLYQISVLGKSIVHSNLFRYVLLISVSVIYFPLYSKRRERKNQASSFRLLVCKENKISKQLIIFFFLYMSNSHLNTGRKTEKRKYKSSSISTLIQVDIIFRQFFLLFSIELITVNLPEQVLLFSSSSFLHWSLLTSYRKEKKEILFGFCVLFKEAHTCKSIVSFKGRRDY